jgi:hypothetical protein
MDLFLIVHLKAFIFSFARIACSFGALLLQRRSTQHCSTNVPTIQRRFSSGPVQFGSWSFQRHHNEALMSTQRLWKTAPFF